MTLKSQETEPLNRERVLEILREQKPILKERFGISDIALYGSFARDNATHDSDIDIIAEFEGEPSASSFFNAKFYLEELFGRPVDFGRRHTIRKEIRPYVIKDMIII